MPRGASFSSVFYQTPGASLGLTLLSANPSKINLHKRHFELPCCTKTKIQSHFHPHGAPAVPWEQKNLCSLLGVQVSPQRQCQGRCCSGSHSSGMEHTQKLELFMLSVGISKSSWGMCSSSARQGVEIISTLKVPLLPSDFLTKESHGTFLKRSWR